MRESVLALSKRQLALARVKTDAEVELVAANLAEASALTPPAPSGRRAGLGLRVTTERTVTLSAWRYRLGQVAVDRRPGDAELGGDLGNGVLAVAVVAGLVVHRARELNLAGS